MTKVSSADSTTITIPISETVEITDTTTTTVPMTMDSKEEVGDKIISENDENEYLKKYKETEQQLQELESSKNDYKWTKLLTGIGALLGIETIGAGIMMTGNLDGHTNKLKQIGKLLGKSIIKKGLLIGSIATAVGAGFGYLIDTIKAQKKDS